MSSILSGLSKGFTSLKNTLGLGSGKKRNNTKRNNKGAATPEATPGAPPAPPAPPAETPPAPPAETPGAPPPGPSQSAGKLMRAANLRYLKFYKPKKSTRRKGKSSRKSKGKKGKKAKKGTRRR